MRHNSIGERTNSKQMHECGSFVNPQAKLFAAGSGKARSANEPTRLCEQKRFQRLIKQVIDIFGSGVLILLLLPVFFLLALLIRCVDGAPVIYRRRVLGRRRSFDAYKFRTMVPDADAMLTADATLHDAFIKQFKLKSDPRVTRIGAWLRKYSLDELPQLFNVVIGQMSLVGPRIITGPELQKYGPYQELLLAVRPGLTGYWQVQGRQEVSYAERVRMDVYYITHWSLGMDLRILMQTPLRVILGEGAY